MPLSKEDKVFFIIIAFIVVIVVLGLLITTHMNLKKDHPNYTGTKFPVVGDWQVYEHKKDTFGDTISRTDILELRHGWLVFRKVGKDAGMVFVPKDKK